MSHEIGRAVAQSREYEHLAMHAANAQLNRPCLLPVVVPFAGNVLLTASFPGDRFTLSPVIEYRLTRKPGKLIWPTQKYKIHSVFANRFGLEKTATSIHIKHLEIFLHSYPSSPR
jgi:hypothetical protein